MAKAPPLISIPGANSCYQDTFIQYLVSLDELPVDDAAFKNQLAKLNKADETQNKFHVILEAVSNIMKKHKNGDSLADDQRAIAEVYKSKQGRQDDMRGEMFELDTIIQGPMSCLAPLLRNEWTATVLCLSCSKREYITDAETMNANIPSPQSMCQSYDVDQSVQCTFDAWVFEEKSKPTRKQFKSIPIKWKISCFTDNICDGTRYWTILVVSGDNVTRVFTSFHHPHLCVSDLDMSRNICLILHGRSENNRRLLIKSNSQSYRLVDYDVFEDYLQTLDEKTTMQFYDPSIDSPVSIRKAQIHLNSIPLECFPLLKADKKLISILDLNLPEFSRESAAGSLGNFSPEADMKYQYTSFQQRQQKAHVCEDCNGLEFVIEKTYTGASPPSRYLTFQYNQGHDEWKSLAPETLSLRRQGREWTYHLHFIGVFYGNTTKGTSGHWASAVMGDHQKKTWHSRLGSTNWDTQKTYEEIMRSNSSGTLKVAAFKRDN